MDRSPQNKSKRKGGLWSGLGRQTVFGFDPARLPVIGRLDAERRYQVLMILMILSLAAMIVFATLYVREISHRADLAEIASELQTQSQRYSKAVQQAIMGDKTAFELLKQSETDFDHGLNVLQQGGGAAIPPGARGGLAEVKQAWQTSQKDIDILLKRKDALVDLRQSVDQINAQDSLVKLAEQAGGKLDVLAQRIVKNANLLMLSDSLPAQTVYQMSKDITNFKAAVEASGNPELKAALDQMTVPVTQILKALPKLIEAKGAARELFQQSEPMLAKTTRLAAAIKSSGYWTYLTLAVAFGLFALLNLFLLALVNVAEARSRADTAAREQDNVVRENQRNQEAILRLLNEMGDLAEGNLTVRTTVTEDITGAIADSVNFAIEELRALVGNVTRAVTQVTQATNEAKALSQEVVSSAEQQTADIGRTTESVNFMSDSIGNVSKNAEESARVAQQSLDFARKGRDSVRDSIAGMNAIRDQIQETSKRIKRLGESSQEIGEIVELIGDITEQTNVLALNAAIQAAAAGEAGRGFTVVAEEVQRLAERSGQATRRIGAIVKTIQTDTQDTINAMESSTHGVVEGAVLSDAAGHALEDIESVSAELARLIQTISGATREQAEAAAGIADNMKQILQQTTQSSSSAQKSADSIGQLTVLAEELRVSVSGFTL